VSQGLKVALFVVLLVGVTAGIWLEMRRASRAEEISYSQFSRDLEGDQLDQLEIHGFSVSGKYKDGKTFHANLPYLDPQLADDIAEHSEAYFDEQDSSWPTVLAVGIPALVIGWIVGVLAVRRKAGPAPIQNG